MNKRIVKLVALLLAISVVIFAFAGCGSSDENGTSEPSGEQGNGPEGQSGAQDDEDPYDKEPMKVSITILDRGQVPAEEGTYEDNRWTKYIDENSGVDVDWVPIVRTQSVQKINALIASGEAPDIMWEFGTTFMLNLKDQGAIQPVDEYVDKYSTVYKAYLEEHPELKPYITADGEMYGITSARGIDTIANHGMWIRKDWLDKLGLKMPATIDELLDVARAFKTQDPDGNGKDDTYGFAFNYNMGGIIEALFFCNGWYIEDGKLVNSQISDRYADVLTFRRTLFQEGLVDKEYITDTNYQRERQIWVTGKTGIYLGSFNPPEFKDWRQNNPNGEIVPLEPVATKYGKNGLWQEPPANRMLVFNKDMKNPKAAMKFLDWVLDKGWFTIKFGIEGENYKLVDGVPQAIDAEKNKKEIGYSGEYAVLDQWNPKPEWFQTMAAPDPISQEEAKLKGMGLETAMKNKFRRDIPYAPSFPELIELQQFPAIRDEIVNKVVTGGVTPQQGLEEIRNEYKRLGGDKQDQLMQEWYDKNKTDLTNVK